MGGGESIPPLMWALDAIIVRFNSVKPAHTPSDFVKRAERILLAYAPSDLIVRGYAAIFLISYFEFMGMRQDEKP